MFESVSLHVLAFARMSRNRNHAEADFLAKSELVLYNCHLLVHATIVFSRDFSLCETTVVSTLYEFVYPTTRGFDLRCIPAPRPPNIGKSPLKLILT